MENTATMKENENTTCQVYGTHEGNQKRKLNSTQHHIESQKQLKQKTVQTYFQVLGKWELSQL